MSRKPTKDQYIARFGEAAYLVRVAALSAKKKRTRARKRLRRLGGNAPVTALLRQNVMNAHPAGCPCFNCLYPADNYGWTPRIARVAL